MSELANNTEQAKRHGRTRTWFQAAWFVLTNGYARGYTSGKIFTGGTKIVCVPGLNCYSCPGALFACPVGALQTVLNKGTFKISLYVFGMLSAFGVLLGRFVCGWLCPFGLVQDLLHKIPLGFKRKSLPGHKYLRYLRFVVLVVMVVALPALYVSPSGTGVPWFCEWICPSGTLLAGIPLVIMNQSFQEIIGFRFAWKVALLVIFCVTALFYYRPFCKYICPLGAFYGVFNSIATYRLEVDSNKCIKCGACQHACGMDIATYQTPNSMDCIRCGDCIAACPTSAIESTWSKTEKRLRERFMIDDEPMTESVNQSSAESVSTGLKNISRIVGVLLVAGGVVSALMCGLYGQYFSFDSYFTLDGMEASGLELFLLAFMKTIASIVVVFAGVRLLRNPDDIETLKATREKLRVALAAYGLGLVFYGIAVLVNPAALSTLMNNILNFFCLLCLPLLFALVKSMERVAEGGKSKVLMYVLLVICCVAVVGFAGFSISNMSYTVRAILGLVE